LAEVIEFVIANEIIPESYRRHKKRSVENMSEGKRVLKRDALIMEPAMWKIGKVSFTRVPRK
jgi:hypothetical protein